MLHLLTFLASLQGSLALPSASPQASDNLFILDAGVGHRSHPGYEITRWRTSLRGLSTSGTLATILQQFGPEDNLEAAIGAKSLAYSTSTSFLYSAIAQEIIRTDIDGSNPTVVIAEEPRQVGLITSVTIAHKEEKLYYSTLYEGLVKRANLDGSNVEVVRNVSQGIKSSTSPIAYANGILVDDEKGWLYWSASEAMDSGSVRRAPLHAVGQEQVLASGVNMPGQLRLIGDMLYWAEEGRWSDSPTAIKRFDLSQLRKFPPQPPSPTAPPIAFATQTVVHSNESSIFFEKDYTGSGMTLSIQSFVVLGDEKEQKIWFVVQSSARTIFGKLVQMTWSGSGNGSKAELEVLNENTTDVGVPVGLEYVSLREL